MGIFALWKFNKEDVENVWVENAWTFSLAEIIALQVSKDAWGYRPMTPKIPVVTDPKRHLGMQTYDPKECLQSKC